MPIVDTEKAKCTKTEEVRMGDIISRYMKINDIKNVLATHGLINLPLHWETAL